MTRPLQGQSRSGLVVLANCTAAHREDVPAAAASCPGQLAEADFADLSFFEYFTEQPYGLVCAFSTG